jgi:hypothetical protein
MDRIEQAGRLLPTLLAALALFTLPACSRQPHGGSFEINGVDARWASGRIDIHLDQDLQLSEEARRALRHGVPLTLEVELVLRDARTQTRVQQHNSLYEIRYLPLSERFQLSGPEQQDTRTFPRLRHALSDLGRLDVSFETGVLPSGEYELLARCFLDKSRMPPPMRLPVMFSREWDHESDWTSWPLEVEPGA